MTDTSRNKWNSYDIELVTALLLWIGICMHECPGKVFGKSAYGLTDCYLGLIGDNHLTVYNFTPSFWPGMG